MGNGIIQGPTVPVIGIPEGVKQRGKRVDFRPDDFDLAIETKGYLLAWERAAICPCAPVVSETEQPDLNCGLCHGHGYFYFGAQTIQDLSAYTFTDIQTRIIQKNNAMVIKGIMSYLVSMTEPYQEVGTWVSGDTFITVRSENKIAYYDRVVALDVEIPFTEVVVADGTDTVPTRYWATGVNFIRSVDTLYKPDTHYYLDKGDIKWRTSSIPESGTRLTAHYLCHPTWLVTEHPHVSRVTLQQYKNANPKTPTGDARQLPIRAKIRYEFLDGNS